MFKVITFLVEEECYMHSFLLRMMGWIFSELQFFHD